MSESNIVYVALWSLPGCLPEMEPARFDTFEEARDYLIDELRTCAAGAEDDHQEEQWVDAAIDMAKLRNPGFCTAPDGYVYEVSTDVE